MTDLLPIIDALAGARVLVVGDAMLDRFTHGTVERVSPDAPVPLLRVDHDSLAPGGAALVAATLAGLGARPDLLSVVGEDEAGATLHRLAADRLGTADGLLTEAGRVTPCTTRFLADGQQLLRTDRGGPAPIRPRQADRLVEQVVRRLPDCALLVLVDHGLGVLTPQVAARLIAAAHHADRRVLVDPWGADYSRYHGAWAVAPNRRNLADATGLPVRNDAEVEAAAADLVMRTGIPTIITTRGAEGMSVITAGVAREEVSARHLTTRAQGVFDASGAGEAVLAVLAAGLAAGADLLPVARLANLAAGLVVGRPGTARLRPADLRAALHRQDREQVEARVAGLDTLLEKAERWRRNGRRIGFTSGSFDLLHPGHIALLEYARSACDRLVVGVGSDACVRRLKGEGRPVQSQSARATVLASLACVDQVVIVEEEAPLALIGALRPDVLVTGAKGAEDQGTGADLVRAAGGTVLLAPLLEGQSTSGTIDRLKG